jgi:hypothetical protein
LFGAELLTLESPKPLGFRRSIESLLPRRRDGETCLIVAPLPADLQALFRIENWRRRFGRVDAWIIDSFLTEQIPRAVRRSRAFDRIYLTREEDVQQWARATGTPTAWLPWGTDALRLGSGRADREWDVVRFGRQPPEWDDDEATALACRERGLRFHGRPQPPAGADPAYNYGFVMEFSALCKYSLAFSNTVDSSTYTHPTRAYITGRWVDALGAGSMVAGVPPKTTEVERLLWPEALLDLGSIRREEGLRVLEEAVRAWRPEQAAEQYRRSLERLDWRWRFSVIAEDLGESPLALKDELQAIDRALDRPTSEAIALERGRTLFS